MTCREISFGSKEFYEELALRDELLRKPLGLSIEDDPTHLEDMEIHLGCFDGTKLIGVLILKPIDDKCQRIKMRQVAVSSDYQGQGVGKNLVNFAEEKAKGLGCECIELHGRQGVLGFYEKLGYDMVGDVFMEVGINHRKMEKHLRKDNL